MSALVPGWHPIAVHFPLALLLCATALLCLARVVGNERLAATLGVVGTWNLILGAAAALVALATGLAAVLGLRVGDAAHQAISLHVRWAFCAALGAVLLAVWRGAGQAADSRPSPLFLALLLLVAAAMIVTGYRGGLNVYRYGIGVAAGAAAASAAY